MPKRTSTTGYADVVITGDSSAVQVMMAKVEFALSAGGLTHFMATMVDPYLKMRAAARFAGEGDDVSGAWLPLAPYTQNIRASKNYGAAHPINRRTGQLENYITQSPVSMDVYATGATLKFPGAQPTGELKEKVRTAQQGKPLPLTPPRPVLGVNEKDLEAVLVGLAMHLESYP